MTPAELTTQIIEPLTAALAAVPGAILAAAILAGLFFIVVWKMMSSSSRSR